MNSAKASIAHIPNPLNSTTVDNISVQSARAIRAMRAHRLIVRTLCCVTMLLATTVATAADCRIQQVGGVPTLVIDGKPHTGFCYSTYDANPNHLLYANHHYLMVGASDQAEEAVLQLPRRTTVTDAMTQETVGSETDQFTVPLRPKEVRLFRLR